MVGQAPVAIGGLWTRQLNSGEPQQLAQQLIPQRLQGLLNGAMTQRHNRFGHRRGEAGDEGHGFRAATPAALLATTGDQGPQLLTLPRDERADAARPLELVGTATEQIHGKSRN